ncbi:MAG TPA: HD domain-containing protein [Nitriliruptorales bacterium]|nr:HD domain-containing protein [Nitriliruptorales bacterium]
MSVVAVVSDPRRASVAPVVLLAGVLGGVWWVSPPAATGAWQVFAAAAAVGELLVIDDLRGRSTPTSFAAVAAFALLANPPWLVAGVSALGWAAAAGIRLLRRRAVEPLDLVQRLAAGWSLAGVAAVGSVLLPDWTVGHAGRSVHVASVAAVSAALTAGPALWSAAEQVAVDRVTPWQAFRWQLTSGWRTSVALASSAALAAAVFGALGHGALLVMVLPVLATREGLHRYAGVRRTYDQTVVAMSRMTELTGHVHPGHGLRVGDLATAVARELGLAEADVHLVERVAHLHEVGRIATDDAQNRAHDREVALAGAAILREAGGLGSVADLVSKHCEPYRVGADGEETPPLPARIVHAACEFDRRTTGDASSGAAALDELLQSSDDLDRRVVAALFRVVHHRTA